MENSLMNLFALKLFDLGPLHVEITQFQSTDENPTAVPTLINSGEISLMLNTEYEEEKDKTEELLKEIMELKKGRNLATVPLKTPAISGENTPTNGKKTPSAVNSRRGSIHQQNSQGGSFLNLPSIPISGQRSRRASIAPPIERPKVYVVRIPVVLTSERSFNSLTDLPSLFLLLLDATAISLGRKSDKHSTGFY
jgi:hypothetical protein